MNVTPLIDLRMRSRRPDGSHITSPDVAQEIGCSTTHVWRFEHGKIKNPTKALKRRYARAIFRTLKEVDEADEQTRRAAGFRGRRKAA